MKKFIVLFGHCDEALDQRISNLRAAGLTEDEIDRVLMDIPKDVLNVVKKGGKLFTQDQLTKARNDERRAVEGNRRHKQPVVDIEEDEDDEIDNTPTPRKTKNQKTVAGITAEQAAEIAKQAAEAATATLKAQNEALQNKLDAVSETVASDKQKAFDTRKAALVAQLPPEVQPLLVGDTIEALETSFNMIKGFMDKAVQDATAANSAQQQVKTHEATVFWKAADGTEFTSANDILNKGGEYWSEYKLSLI